MTAVRVAMATARGGRIRNEDVIGVNGWVLAADPGGPLELLVPVGGDRPALVAVVDGMGGAPAGQRAARIAAQRLTGAAVRGAAAARQSLSDVFGAAHTALREAGRGPDRGMGCTAGLLMVYPDGTAVAANVGDVRAYRIVDSYAGQLTEDHRADPRGSVVTKCLGGNLATPSEPDFYQVEVRDGDRLLLCSDGIHDAVDAAVIERAARHRAGGAMVAELVRSAVATGHGDNATVAVLDVAGAPGSGGRSAG